MQAGHNARIATPATLRPVFASRAHLENVGDLAGWFKVKRRSRNNGLILNCCLVMALAARQVQTSSSKTAQVCHTLSLLCTALSQDSHDEIADMILEPSAVFVRFSQIPE